MSSPNLRTRRTRTLIKQCEVRRPHAMARPSHEPTTMWRPEAHSGSNAPSISAVTQSRRTRMNRLPLIGLALAATFLGGLANAEELTGTLKKVKETGVITIGYRDSSIPFSYLDDNQKPIGFAIDICYKIVEAVKAELKLDKLTAEFNPVTSSTRIPWLDKRT